MHSYFSLEMIGREGCLFIMVDIIIISLQLERVREAGGSHLPLGYLMIGDKFYGVFSRKLISAKKNSS